jgi:hypothetical protein
MKRNKLVLPLFLLLILTACHSNLTNNDVKGLKDLPKIEPVQVNFLGHWLGEGQKELLLKQFVTEFEFTNQDIKINMKYPENVYFDRRYPNIEFKFNAAIVLADNPAWDIIRLNGEFQKVADILHDQDWAKKYLVDFSEIPEFRNTTKPELLTDYTKSLYGGIIPGPLIDGYNWPLWCNTEVAQKIGIEVKQFDMTNEDFLNYLKAVYSYNQSHNDQIIGIYEAGNWKTSQAIAEMLFFSEVGDYNEIIDNKFSQKKLNAWEKVLHELERYSKYKPISPDWEKTTWTETTNYPLTGKCLFYSNATWMYNIWSKEDSSKLKNMLPTESPVFKASPICLGGYSITWAVLKKSPHRDQAIRFLLALNTPDFAEEWARYTKSPSGIKGNLTSVNFGFDKFEDFEYDIKEKYGEKKTPVCYNSLFCFGQGNENLNNFSLEVLFGKMTANQAITEIKKKIKRK